ncbi:MAG TPA: (2Fe-2S) ferredoxin domain-containing protein [Thermoguttaceae bacterium]|nr:(2Fe-2S) ferredoxin domain-containing protein [Thermoguttaceae bacterium]
MEKPDYHLFVCGSFRVSGDPQGICHRKGAVDLLQYLEGEIIDRGLNAVVSSTGCLKVCEKGPAMVVYPSASWYGGLNEEKLDEILDAMEEGQPAEALLID